MSPALLFSLAAEIALVTESWLIATGPEPTSKVAVGSLFFTASGSSTYPTAPSVLLTSDTSAAEFEPRCPDFSGQAWAPGYGQYAGAWA